MPEDYPDYPDNSQILAYTRSFAQTFKLHEAIRFNTGIDQVEPDGALWQVRLSTGETYIRLGQRHGLGTSALQALLAALQHTRPLKTAEQ